MLDKNNKSKVNDLIQIICLIVSVVLVFLFFSQICLIKYIPSESMEGTILKGDIAFVNALSYKDREIERGDVVVFDASKNTSKSDDFVKRVVGLPNDTIEIRNNVVYVNGEQLYEDYTNGLPTLADSETTFVVPENSYFVLGDNRVNSNDSRYWKNSYVEKDNIKGRVVFNTGLGHINFDKK